MDYGWSTHRQCWAIALWQIFGLFTVESDMGQRVESVELGWRPVAGRVPAIVRGTVEGAGTPCPRGLCQFPQALCAWAQVNEVGDGHRVSSLHGDVGGDTGKN